MIDKISIVKTLENDKEIIKIAERNHLQLCKKGNNIVYESPKEAKFTGIDIRIKDYKITIKCSLHKQYHKEIYGTLDNSQQFTISNAKQTVDRLFDKIGITKERAKITSYEIGISMPMQFLAIEYIGLMERAVCNKINKTERGLFIDAYYKINRQRTTEKGRNKKKYFKVYDKGFEQLDRKKLTKNYSEKILRIETVYKKQSILVKYFFDIVRLKSLTNIFYRDWIGVEFSQNITADKGVKNSEIEKAKNVLKFGCDEYLRKINKEFKAGLITAKQYRTVREFTQNWERNKHKYRNLPTAQETDYREKLVHWFNIVKY